jgi:hypothetical protein
VLLLLLTSFVAAFATSADQTQNTIKEKYRNLEVGTFTIEKGIELPADYFATLPQEIVSQLEAAKLFEKVSTVSVDTATGSRAAVAPVLRMTGVITAFHPGSRKGRYFGGRFNPGAYTQIYAYIQYVDAATNTLIVENEVVGTLTSGLGGGNSKNVVHEFATSLVETTKFILLKPPLSSADEPANVEDAPCEKVELSESAFDAAQSKVNELAAKGYRLVSFKTTSYQTANLVMAKTGESAQYQYVFDKALLPTSVQKELTKKSLEGYRYRPHTMIMLKNHVFAIAERDAKAPASHYEYRLHATVLVSSAEKNIRDDQAKGFVLIDCRKTSENQHMLLLERKLED